MKIIHNILKVLLSLLLLMPVLGTLGVMPEPTRDLYNTDEAFAFIQSLYASSYILYTMAIVHVFAIIALWTKREALAALLIAPITVNIIGFHIFLDGLFNTGSLMAVVLCALNIYFLWKNKETYKVLLEKKNS
ncbi:MAG: hypothetical protein COX80_05180 [Candidatus Magasanikbacteria bacterium CG_4_10_14_0_2_um_filter_33_14]|uniref:DoxX family protein n=1 Tax=Candidatus Magasanikbacteria bacterium CG_4_10_14_0_2_um_filter_33_14 TaxID=1974636 RepID=A0A2M7V892_9BACT|nr:MAG: hypothetical protein COX80_05180 [Candidatus Magasanikbacteria bacterium CG_4_10_14_0_2_um_filter_33_14]